jgi:hypothetical protein
MTFCCSASPGELAMSFLTALQTARLKVIAVNAKVETSNVRSNPTANLFPIAAMQDFLTGVLSPI